MTLDILKTNKKLLESQIKELILKFQEDNSVMVNDIELSTHTIEYKMVDDSSVIISKDVDVKIKLDLGV